MQERAQKAALRVAGGHAAQCGPARAAQEAHELILAEIFALMAGEQPVAARLAAYVVQQGIAGLAGRFFQTCAGRTGHDPHGSMAEVVGDMQRGAETLYLLAFGIGLRPQAVMDGTDMQTPVLTGSKQSQYNGQGGGIPSAGNRQQQRLAVRDAVAKEDAFQPQTLAGHGGPQLPERRRRRGQRRRRHGRPDAHAEETAITPNGRRVPLRSGEQASAADRIR